MTGEECYFQDGWEGHLQAPVYFSILYLHILHWLNSLNIQYIYKVSLSDSAIRSESLCKTLSILLHLKCSPVWALLMGESEGLGAFIILRVSAFGFSDSY